MTIPENPADQAAWLESLLVGPDLGRLVAELRAVHGANLPAWSLDAVLGRWADAVLRNGLSALPRKNLRELLQHPGLLLELQERVLVNGSAYWSVLPVPEEFAQAVDKGWERLKAKVEARAPRPSPAPQPIRGKVGLIRRVVPYALTSLATAAAILIGVYFGLPMKPQGPEIAATVWGWQKPDAFPTRLDRAAYLNRLADEADEWFRKRPSTSADLARRIGEFRQGCSALLLADHRPLPEKDQKWLKERCRAWSKALDEQLTQLEETGDVNPTLAATDATIQRLVKALRDQAHQA